MYSCIIIFFAYLWSFRWPNYIVTLPRYFSFQLPHLNIPTGPPSNKLDKNSQRTWLIKNCSQWNGYNHFRGHSKRKWISFYTSSLHNLHIHLFFLKIEIWSSEPLVYDLKYYWNVQILELIQNPFPLDINCNKTIINLVRVWYDGRFWGKINEYVDCAS
jgi:hypothetical protein